MVKLLGLLQTSFLKEVLLINHFITYLIKIKNKLEIQFPKTQSTRQCNSHKFIHLLHIKTTQSPFSVSLSLPLRPHFSLAACL
jgi:hypothetical protein